MQLYIKNKDLFDKFFRSFNDNRLIIITGATGVGKTAFIEEALKEEEYSYFSLKNNFESITNDRDILVIDDFQYIVDKEHLLKSIVSSVSKAKHPIIISRSNPTDYFMDVVAEKGVFTINERDLVFNREMLDELFEGNLTEEQINYLANNSMGFPLVFLYLASKVKEGEKLSDELFNQSRMVYVGRLKTAVFDNIDPEVLKFLLQISVVDEFDIDLAVAITKNDISKHLAAKAMKYGNFLFLKDGVYHIRDVMLYALRSQSFYYYSLQEYNEFKLNAAAYYEKNGEIGKALYLYEKTDSVSSIKRILVRNSTSSPALGDFRFLKRYYETLQMEEILANPTLICGMSMLYALFLDKQKSEYYYGLLKEKAETAQKKELLEINNLIDYLDVALPQRTIKDIYGNLSSKIQKENSKSKGIPYSLMGNNCSVVNGDKDFTSFINKHYEITKAYTELIDRNDNADLKKGLSSLTKAECAYETGKDQVLVMDNIVKAKMEIDKSKTAYDFLIVRLEAMLSLERGDALGAINVVNLFLASLPKDKRKRIEKDTNAFKAFISIYADKEEEVDSWLKSNAKDNVDFFVPERDEYLVSVYANIYLHKYAEAYEIIQKLKFYAKEYDRSYVLAEAYLLESIIEHHMESDYVEALYQGLAIAQERSLIRLVSNMGVTIDNMIYEQRKKLEEMGISKDFLLELNPYLLNMATRYPNFLNKEDNIIPKLSKTGVMILQLQSQGYSLNMISERLQINLETIRYHAKQNYKKLGAASNAEAVTIAKKYQII